MTNTPYLDLALIGTTEEEVKILFKDWRLLVMGNEQSNMSKIDSGFYSLSTKIATLETNTSMITRGGLGDKFLADDGTYKIVSGGGGGGSIFMTDTYLEFTPEVDTQTFTIGKVNTDSQVVLYKDNLLMIQEVNYTIDKTTGIIDLPFVLKAGETIYYQVNKSMGSLVTSSIEGNIQSATSKYLLDDVGNVISPKVKYSDIIGVGDILSGEAIADNLTTTTKGKVLDASQGKILADKIGNIAQLPTDSKSDIVNAMTEVFTKANGALQFRGVCANDLSDTILSSGIWITNATDELTNIPSWWLKNTRKTIINFGVDIINSFSFMIIIDYATGEICYQQGIGFDWISLTKPTKFVFYCTAGETVNIISQECYIVNNEFTINARITRTDSISFSEMVALKMPANFVPTHYIVGSAMGKGSNGGYNKITNCFVGSDGNIRVIPQDNDIKEIVLTIKGGY